MWTRGRDSKRTIWPFATLGLFRPVRVVVAWCETPRGLSHFRTDRIRKVQFVTSVILCRRSVLLKHWRATEGIPEHCVDIFATDSFWQRYPLD